MSRLILRTLCLFLMQVPLDGWLSIVRGQDVLNALSGRYSSHFENGDVQGNVYWSDNVAEIVAVTGDAAYIRIELNFYNGHTCSISGIGQVSDGRILYNDHAETSPDEPPCILSVSKKGDNLLIDDGEGSCKMYCGARGSLSGDTLPFSSRRPISYINRLKSSQEYKDALQSWQAHQKR